VFLLTICSSRRRLHSGRAPRQSGRCLDSKGSGKLSFFLTVLAMHPRDADSSLAPTFHITTVLTKYGELFYPVLSLTRAEFATRPSRLDPLATRPNNSSGHLAAHGRLILLSQLSFCWPRARYLTANAPQAPLYNYPPQHHRFLFDVHLSSRLVDSRSPLPPASRSLCTGSACYPPEHVPSQAFATPFHLMAGLEVCHWI
jgi:hypothetical protein